MKNLSLFALPAITLPALTLLAACVTTPTPSGDGWAALGQTTRAGTALVQPIRVTEDSRCPMNARCVWAGRVTLAARIQQGGRWRNVTMHSDAPLAVDGGVLDIDEIAPPSFMTDAHPQPGDYRFHFTMR